MEPVEAVVVTSRAHRVTFGDLCLDCGGDALTGACEPLTFEIPPEVWNRAVVVPGEAWEKRELETR